MKSTRQMTCELACSPRPTGSDFYRLFLLLVALLALPVYANTDVEHLLAEKTPPDGVVIEIVEGDEDALESLLPRVRATMEQIHQRFPDTEIAVVTHGSEQFALQSRYREDYPSVHSDVQALVDANVPVHVCGAHAGWYGVGTEDFPDYVDVAPSGPAQINMYKSLGYLLLRIQADD